MNDEYLRLKARYRETRIADFNEQSTYDFSEAFKRSICVKQELADFCAANGIDRADFQKFVAEVDQEYQAACMM